MQQFQFNIFRALVPALAIVAAGLFAADMCTAAPGRRVEVPMDLASGRPGISVSLGGSNVPVVYDTGAGGAVITKSLADKLGLEVVGESRVGSPGGGEPMVVKLVSLEGMSVGGYALTNAHAAVLDDAKLPPNATMVIGSNQFADALIEIDFVNKRLGITKGGTASTSSGAWQKLDGHGLPEASLVIGKETIPLHIDSGNPGALVVPKRYAEKLPLTGPLQESGAIRLVDRRMPVYSAPMQTDAVLAGTPVRIDGHVRFSDLPFANVGGSVLAKTRMVIDMPNRRWQLVFADGGVPVIGAPAPVPKVVTKAE